MRTAKWLEVIGPKTWSDQVLMDALEQNHEEMNALLSFCIRVPKEHYLQYSHPDPECFAAVVHLCSMYPTGQKMLKEARRRNLAVPSTDPYVGKAVRILQKWSVKSSANFIPSIDRQFLASCGVSMIDAPCETHQRC